MIVETKYFGTAEYAESALIRFPEGLPGFEDFTEFVCFEQPTLRPLTYLQSVTDAHICFLVLPVRAIEPSYNVELSGDQARVLRLGCSQPTIGNDIACMAILCSAPGREATANLAAPVVINIAERIGLQVVQTHSEYDCAHPLVAPSAAEVVC
jgi:flagellar assembly factor FliW